jgi:hypothetical protein
MQAYCQFTVSCSGVYVDVEIFDRGAVCLVRLLQIL